MGTLLYAAPEVVKGGVMSASSDCWSLGVLLYLLLSGVPPFLGDPSQTGFRYSLRGERWAKISGRAKHLIKGLMAISPESRLNTRQVLNHPWFTPYYRTLVSCPPD